AAAMEPQAAAATVASISRRVDSICSPHAEVLELGVPRCPIRTREQFVRLSLTDDFFTPSVPTDLTAQPERDIGQVTDDRDTMGACEIGDRRPPRLDAVEEVTDVALELIALVACVVFDGLDPGLGRPGRFDTGGATHRMIAGEVGNDVGRRHFGV